MNFVEQNQTYLVENILSSYTTSDKCLFRRRFEDFPPNDLMSVHVSGVKFRSYSYFGTQIIEYFIPFEEAAKFMLQDAQLFFGLWVYDEEQNMAIEVERQGYPVVVNKKNFHNMQQSFNPTKWGVAYGSKPFLYMYVNDAFVIGLKGNEVYIANHLNGLDDWAANLD